MVEDELYEFLCVRGMNEMLKRAWESARLTYAFHMLVGLLEKKWN